VKILTVIGARPQFVKASAVSRAIQLSNTINNVQVKEYILHTGQHFDPNMSDIFFDELGIPKADFNLGISNLAHGAMTGRMIEAIEKKLIDLKPDYLLVYGDTNSTLAAAIAASKIQIPLLHIEAGLRSFNLSMPEEINRILTDRISSFLFCPTQTAMDNLKKEGFPHITLSNNPQLIFDIGDVMHDVTLHYKQQAIEAYPISNWGLEEKGYGLCTIHRAENVDNHKKLEDILLALSEVSNDIDIVLPLHPRTKQIIEKNDKSKLLDKFIITEPLSYLKMQSLESSAQVIFTDSGGVQKEAYFHKIPCITLREETEWVETIDSGWNTLAGSDKKRIISSYFNLQCPKIHTQPYGDGNASKKFLDLLIKNHG